MNRIEKALCKINRSDLGLEIGPCHSGIAPKRDGFNVDILDHASKEDLLIKYKNSSVNLQNIENVDYIWNGQPLSELIGTLGKYDYIIASHVIEHITDPISFFIECEKLLKPDGILSLIVPDKRYHFDYFRWPSSTGDVLDAYINKKIRHSPGTVFDFCANSVRMGENTAWSKGDSYENVSFINNVELAHKFLIRAQESDEYLDVHSWRFTPSSFKLILHDLNKLGIIKLSEICSFDTAGCEFHITLGKHTNAVQAEDRLILAKAAMNEMINQ